MSINETVAAYIEAKETESAAKKRADMLKKIILEHAGNAETFVTDEYTVIIKITPALKLDTAALYKDFPDIKNTYGRMSSSTTVTAARTPAAAKATA